ncbi:MAG TPA: hypothetical protein PKZ76_17215, partial [Xanthomonadaceae bacterium]|nr:hypothetical protein [Xanthomonadaceae bacterium]
LSFGYFSLDEQRKVTRPPGGGRNQVMDDTNIPRRRRSEQELANTATPRSQLSQLLHEQASTSP